MGERAARRRAAGLDTVPAIVRDTTDDAMLRDALLENIHRVQLNPLEEAAAYQQLLEEFGATHEELASKIGRSRSQVTNTIRLMKLPVKVQTRVAAGVISAGHARALLGLPDADAQDALATRIVAEGMSVRATEEAVAMAAAEQPAARRRARKISARGRGTRHPAVRHVRDQGQDPDRPGQGAHRRRVRLGRRPAADHRRHGPGDHRTPSRRLNGPPPVTGSRRSVGVSGLPVTAPYEFRAAPARREQLGEDLAQLVAGRLDRHREHRRLGETGRHVHLEEVDLAVRADDRVGAGQVGQAEHLVHPDRQGRRAGGDVLGHPGRRVVLGEAGV